MKKKGMARKNRKVNGDATQTTIADESSRRVKKKSRDVPRKKTTQAPPAQAPTVSVATSPIQPQPSTPVAVAGTTSNANTSAEVAKWIQRALDMGVDSLRSEYRGLAKYTMPEMTIEAFKTNHEAGRNRYQDVPCQDQDRVVLKRGPVEYIHANYVSTPRDAKRFICTQGPLDNTISEFWAMVVQENAGIIVMLCNTIEMGKYKCAQYWPLNVGETMKFPDVEILVTNNEMAPMPNEPTIVTTKLTLKFREGGSIQTRPVIHHQWVDWPDRGVPPCRLTSMELLSCVRGSKFPIVVHCSAGIGRTGTIVAIEYILERIFANEDCTAMNELLMKLRHQRAFSIQNDLQYLYVHRVMLCYFLEKHNKIYGALLNDPANKAKYEKFVADYNKVTTVSS